REVECPLESEGTATVDGVVPVRAAPADCPISEEEYRLHGSARGSRERSRRATADVHGPRRVARGRGVEESDAGTVDRAPGYLEAASVEDVDPGRERHLGGPIDAYAVAVDARLENPRTAADGARGAAQRDCAGAVIAGRRGERWSRAPGQ